MAQLQARWRIEVIAVLRDGVQQTDPAQRLGRGRAAVGGVQIEEFSARMGQVRQFRALANMANRMPAATGHSRAPA